MTLAQADRVFAYVAFCFWRRVEPARVVLGMRLPEYLDILKSACPDLAIRLFHLAQEFKKGFAIILEEVERELAESLTREQHSLAYELTRLEKQRLLSLTAQEADRDASLLTELDPEASDEARDLRMQLQRLAEREDLAEPAKKRLERKYLDRMAPDGMTSPQLHKRWESLARQAILGKRGASIEEQRGQVADGPHLILEALKQKDTWKGAETTIGDVLDRALKAAKYKMQYGVERESDTVPRRLDRIDYVILGQEEQDRSELERVGKTKFLGEWPRLSDRSQLAEWLITLSPCTPETSLLQKDLHEQRKQDVFARAQGIRRADRRRHTLAILTHWFEHPDITQAEVAKQLSLAVKTVTRCLQELTTR